MMESNKYNRKDPFKVPENYFDDLPERVMYKISAGKENEHRGIIYMIRPYMMFAAAMIIFVLISYTGLKLIFQIPEDKMQDKLLGEYTELLLEDIDDLMIINEFTESMDYSFSEDLSNEEIIEYLVNEDIDYLAIVEKL